MRPHGQTASAGARFTAAPYLLCSGACVSANAACQQGVKSCVRALSLPRCIFQFLTNPTISGTDSITDIITYTFLKWVKPADTPTQWISTPDDLSNNTRL